jgi:SPP1 gp7 family putative phage head morphogenesis protein
MTIPELDPSDYNQDNEIPEELLLIVAASIKNFEKDRQQTLVVGATKNYLKGVKIAYKRAEKKFVADEVEDDVYSFLEEYQKQIKDGYTIIQGEKVHWLRDRSLAERQFIFDTISNSIRGGEGPIVTGKKLNEYFEMSKRHAELIARTETAYVQSKGRDDRYKKFGVERVKWLLGKNPCPRCASFGGRIFKWDDLPYSIPVHPRCFSDDTEVCTIDGFKLIKDVKINEECMSIDPETFELEWVKVKNVYSYKYSGALFSFTSDVVDLLVTPDHSMLVKEDEEWIFKDASQVKNDAGFCIVERPSIEWPEYVTDVKKSTEDYNGFVCCVELEKFHTLYVRRNGKCAWSGNCTCDLAPILNPDEKETPYVPKEKPVKEPKEPKAAPVKKEPVKKVPVEKPKAEPKKPIKEPERTREEVEKIIRDKEHTLIDRTTEKGILYNKNGKILLEKEGDAESVSFTKAERKRMNGNVLTHNHPGIGVAFSDADLRMACAYNLNEIRATGKTGTHIIKMADGSNFNEELYINKIQESYEKHRKIEFANHNRRMQEMEAGTRRVKVTEDESFLWASRKIWTDVARDVPELKYELVKWD